jgi:protoporphyrinogen oxidase
VRRGNTAVVGAGILGLTTAYRLLSAGSRVTVFERAPDLGGLVGSFDFAGRATDRFYHVILPTDERVIGLAKELGLEGRFRFRPTAVGFYDDGRYFSMSSLSEFARFPLLAPQDRIRLAAFVARCQLTSDCSKLDNIQLAPWLRRWCGRRAVERLWQPLLDSKFDGQFDDLPASYLWARTRRMSKTRDASGREIMGWLEGGYQTLIDALATRIRSLGGEIHAATNVDRIVGGSNGVTGLVVDGHLRQFDTVVCTLMPPLAHSLLDDRLRTKVAEDECRYLGVVCVLLRTTRNVSPYYTLNITDRRVPLTTVVQTTHVVDPAHAGGHLLYATKYVDPSHPDLSRDAAEVERDYLGHVRTLFPDLRDEEIDGVIMQRARMVEPVHPIGVAGQLPEMFPAPGLALASTAHVYPEIVNGQAVLGVAERLVAGLLERGVEANEAIAA